jgi:hypothetical protein
MKRMQLIIAVLGLFLFVQTAEADWTPTKRLTWNSGLSRNPKVVVDIWGTLHMVWEDNTPAYYEIFYSQSMDGGATWTAGKRLTWTSDYSVFPDLAIYAAVNLYVVWMEGPSGNHEIYFKKSTDSGATWTASKRITWTSGLSQLPDITIDFSGNIHLVWDDSMTGNNVIYYKKSMDGGGTWTAGKRMSWTSSYNMYPDMATDSSGHLYLVWSAWTGANTEICYRKSTDGGATWATMQNLSLTPGTSFNPAIAIYGPGNLHVVWQDATPGEYEIYYCKSTNAGATWTTSKRLTWNAGDSTDSTLSLDSSGNLHVVWDDATTGNNEIYYKESTDEGATWTSNKRLTWTSGLSGHPDLVVDILGNLHVFWQEDTSGNCEIYYRKHIK